MNNPNTNASLQGTLGKGEEVDSSLNIQSVDISCEWYGPLKLASLY
ncbi:MAG: hypothetical protein PUD93_06610 [Lachnospiraceae bacterium]|nr:hypothetical protein [Lachnospiraceae bacterium]